MSRLLLFFSALSVFAVSCGEPPLYIKVGNSLDEAVFKAPYDMVWEATLKAMKDENVKIDYKFEDGPVANYNCDMVANRPMLRTSQGEFRGFRYAFEIKLTKGSDAQTTNIKLKPILEAYEWRMYRDWFKCESKGVIEDRVFQEINKHLKEAMAAKSKQ